MPVLRSIRERFARELCFEVLELAFSTPPRQLARQRARQADQARLACVVRHRDVVLADPRAYTALLYMLLSLATGTLYFTWAVTGISLSLGLAILIIGIPFAILFFASVRGISLVEGRVVEALLGERMPRRPLYTDR